MSVSSVPSNCENSMLSTKRFKESALVISNAQEYRAEKTVLVSALDFSPLISFWQHVGNFSVKYWIFLSCRNAAIPKNDIIISI